MNTGDASIQEESFPFAQEGYALMAAAFEVYGELGGGLAKDIYQEAMEHELGLRGISFNVNHEMSVFYKGEELKKRYTPDLLVSGGIIVGIQSTSALTSEDFAQLMNYMRVSCQSVGYLINFGPIHKVEWKRIILREFIDKE
jgi:GxxExxY protein